MIVDENVREYIMSLEPDLPDYLVEIERFGIDNGVPIIKKDAQQLLRFVMNTYKPKRILEIGTAIGFSASLMNYFSPESHITTLEISEDRINDAQGFISKNGLENKIQIIKGDAADTLNDLVNKNCQFDFVFMDAAKAQYGVYLDSIKKLLVSGGTLLTDNILQEGSVCDSKFSIARRDRTIHKRMREFLRDIMKSELFNSCIIPIGDGMLLSTKN